MRSSRAIWGRRRPTITLHPRLPWANTEVGNVVKGIAFGTILAVMALGVLTPLVYAPARGTVAGVFSTELGWQYIVGVFLFHWIYGAHLGLVYSPIDERDGASWLTTNASGTSRRSATSSTATPPAACTTKS